MEISDTVLKMKQLFRGQPSETLSFPKQLTPEISETYLLTNQEIHEKPQVKTNDTQKTWRVCCYQYFNWLLMTLRDQHFSVKAKSIKKFNREREKNKRQEPKKASGSRGR